MEEQKRYFVTGIGIQDSTNPFLILLSADDTEFRHEIIVCRNARYNQQERSFGNRDLSDLFVNGVAPMRFEDKVVITEDDGYRFPVRIIQEDQKNENDDDVEKWVREIGIEELNEAVPDKYSPSKIMNFIATKDSILNSDVLMGEDRYFSEYCDRRVMIEIKNRLSARYLKRYNLTAMNDRSVAYELLLPADRKNYHLRFRGIDPIRDPGGLTGGLTRFRMKIMKHAYEQVFPFGTVSLPGNRELLAYGAKWAYNDNRFPPGLKNNKGAGGRHVILGPIKGRFLCYCRITGSIKLGGVDRQKVAHFIKKNRGGVVHYRRKGGVIFPSVPLTRIEPSDYDVMITALKNMAKVRGNKAFYKNGSVVYGKKNYKPKRGTTTFDYSNFYASCLMNRLSKLSPNLSNICRWLTKRRVTNPECKREIVRLLGNLKHRDEYAFNVMKTESVNVMLKTLELNDDKSVVSVCTDSVTFDGRVDRIILPYPESFSIKMETRLKPGTCFYQGPTCYFGLNELNDDRLVLKGIVRRESSPPIIREFIETVVREEIVNSRREFNTMEMLIRPDWKEYLFHERPDNRTKFYPGEMAYQDSAHDTALCYANMRDNPANRKILSNQQNVNWRDSAVVHKFFPGGLVHVNAVFSLDMDKYEATLNTKLEAAFKLLLRAYPKRRPSLRHDYGVLKRKLKRTFFVLTELQKGACVPGALFDPACTTLFSGKSTTD